MELAALFFCTKKANCDPESSKQTLEITELSLELLDQMTFVLLFVQINK